MPMSVATLASTQVHPPLCKVSVYSEFLFLLRNVHILGHQRIHTYFEPLRQHPGILGFGRNQVDSVTQLAKEGK
jgi:hypothetical protein